jgi:prepilin-type N-terminal cleavage/methylation domain-containing protein
MKTPPSSPKHGFTLLETVIAIGVLAVLLTGFMVVFAPAAAGIRKSINIQEADRLASTVEQELVTRRGPEIDKYPTGFAKAYELIKNSDKATDALFVYQYRGSLSSLRPDGTPAPMDNIKDKVPGKDYTVQTMLRSRKDTLFLEEDLAAVEGSVYLVKCTQLVFNNGALTLGSPGKIVDPKNPGTEPAGSDDYPEAVIAFSAEFFSVPAKSQGYYSSQFDSFFSKIKDGKVKPIFTRNLAVRR